MSIPQTAARSLVAVTPTADRAGKAAPAASRPLPTFIRPPAILGSYAHAAQLYDPKNPNHEVLRKENEDLAARAESRLRELKHEGGLHGKCILRAVGERGERLLLIGTAKNHSLMVLGPKITDEGNVEFKNGKVTSFDGNVNPVTLNRYLTYLEAALDAPGAMAHLQLLGQNGPAPTPATLDPYKAG